MYGLCTAEYHCLAHAASGIIKRPSTSKTMNVSEVTVHYACILMVVKHFETKVKNKELLDDAMKILEVKPLHLTSSCKTGMEHFLKAKAIFDDMLPAVYYVMFTQNKKPDEKDAFITPKNVFILKIITELHDIIIHIFSIKQIKGTYLFQLFTILLIFLQVRWKNLRQQMLIDS